ncbi:cytochrome c551 peroxidase [gamma proteobacterium HTCC5015]|nr:cytochrome c551 peroxidase [gamma proteobacterium HTCC5015]
MLKRWGVCALAVLLTACGQDTDQRLQETIERQEIAAKPSVDLPIPAADEPLAELGRALFFSPHLSGGGDVACVSCHHPFRGGDEDLSLAVGINAEDPLLFGHRRKLDESKMVGDNMGHKGMATMPRNVPTDFASTYYQKALFWDGRVRFDEVQGNSQVVTPDSLFDTPDHRVIEGDLLFAQTRFPVTNPDEMLGFETPYANTDGVRLAIEARMRSVQNEAGEGVWLPAFQRGLQEPDADESIISFFNISKAITAYIRSKDFIDTPWARYVEGDKEALNQRQKRGAALFFQAKGDGQSCASCHRPPFFSDERYYNLAVPQIGPGMDKLDADYGRKRVTRNNADQFRFRTPSLLNVEHTAPYMHNGAYETLFDTVWHHIHPEKSIEQYDFTLQHLLQFEGRDVSKDYPHMKANTEFALNKARENGLPELDYTREEVELIVSFLEALTDPCIESEQCMSAWMPTDAEIKQLKLLDMRLSSPEGRPQSERLFQ